MATGGKEGGEGGAFYGGTGLSLKEVPRFLKEEEDEEKGVGGWS